MKLPLPMVVLNALQITVLCQTIVFIGVERECGEWNPWMKHFGLFAIGALGLLLVVSLCCLRSYTRQSVRGLFIALLGILGTVRFPHF